MKSCGIVHGQSNAILPPASDLNAVFEFTSPVNRIQQKSIWQSSSSQSAYLTFNRGGPQLWTKFAVANEASLDLLSEMQRADTRYVGPFTELRKKKDISSLFSGSCNKNREAKRSKDLREFCTSNVPYLSCRCATFPPKPVEHPNHAFSTPSISPKGRTRRDSLQKQSAQTLKQSILHLLAENAPPTAETSRKIHHQDYENPSMVSFVCHVQSTSTVTMRTVSPMLNANWTRCTTPNSIASLSGRISVGLPPLLSTANRWGTRAASEPLSKIPGESSYSNGQRSPLALPKSPGYNLEMQSDSDDAQRMTPCELPNRFLPIGQGNQCCDSESETEPSNDRTQRCRNKKARRRAPRKLDSSSDDVIIAPW